MDATFNDKNTFAIKLGDTATTLSIDLYESGKTVVVPEETVEIILTSKKGSAKVLGIPSPNVVNFNITDEAYKKLGEGPYEVRAMIDDTVIKLTVDIIHSLGYNSKVAESDKTTSQPRKPAIPALTGKHKEVTESASSLFDRSGYDI